MKAKSPIVALTPNTLDRVTGGCKLASVPSAASARSPKPSFGLQVETGLGADGIGPLRDLDALTEHATSLASELLSSVDLGMVNDIATEAIGDAVSSLPPLWCGPTSGADWGDAGEASEEMDDIDDDDDDEDDDDIVQQTAPSSTAPMFLDDEATDLPIKDERPADRFDKFDRGDIAAEPVMAGEPGSAWGFVDGPPPASAPIRQTDVAAEDTAAPAVDANNFFVQGPPPAMAPIRGATAAAPTTSLAFEAAPSSSGHAQVRDHRR